MKGRKIVQAVGTLESGGAERVALELCCGLRQRGWDVELAVLVSQRRGLTRFEEPLRTEAARRGVVVRDIPLGSIRSNKDRGRWLRYLGESQVSLLHAHNRPGDWQLAVLSRLAWRPFLYTRHLPYADLSGRQRLLYAAAARSAASVVAVSRTVAAHLQESEGAPRRKIRVIPNGIDTKKFTPLPPEKRRALRQSLGVKDEEFLWITAARLAQQKGLLFLVDAMAKLSGESKARLLVAGEGPERKTLEEKIAAGRLEKRVQLLGLRTNVAELLGAADGYANTSLSEGHPLGILEALSAGLPVVAPRLKAIQEVAAPGNPVFFGPEAKGWAKAHDAGEIANALFQVERERPDVTPSRKFVEDRYSLTKMLDAHEALYEEVLG